MFLHRHSLCYEQPFLEYDECVNTEEVIDFASGADGGMSDTSALIGFVAGDTPGCSYGFSAEDPIYEKAIAECYVIKESPSFCEGILLKCIDKQRHYEEIKDKIITSYRQNSSTTSNEIAKALKIRNICISPSQIRRYRSRLGFKRTTTKYCHTIREQNKVTRLLFAQEMIDLNESFYDCVFTDECTIQIDCTTRFCFIQEGDQFARLRNRAKHPSKVHVWGGISARGATQLVIIPGSTRINSEYYCRILKQAYLPFLSAKYGGCARLVQDNAPAHTSGFTKTKLKEWAVDVLQWPAESPDLNPIELVWGNMKNAIRSL
ncbi:hypothetical protein Aduo_014222 [Ancylostoma duodenale]